MSHLSILPTVLRDADLLIEALRDLALPVQRGGELSGFAGQKEAVLVRAQMPEGLWLGWVRQSDGNLALVGDLQQLSRSRSLQQLIGRITRGYAARRALAAAQRDLAGAAVHPSITLSH
jgi:hypothetical protein